MTRRFSVLSAFDARALIVVFAVCLAALAGAASALASLTPGDVVVERDGNGGVESISSSAQPVHLDEFGPVGGLAESIALPTTESGLNKPFTDSGSSSSDGLLTLSENGACLVTAGYDAKLGTEHITESKAKEVPRVVAVVNGKGEVNTETALTNFANENNARGAASTECKKLWLGGNGTKTTGGVVATEVGKKEVTQLNEGDHNVRQVEVVHGQLYTDADPTKNGVTIATVGTGEPTTKGQSINNLNFEPAPPEQPYAYSFLTLGLGSTPDTLYVADKRKEQETSVVAKYSLVGGTWVERGSVEIPEVSGVTARDVGGLVTIYATSAGLSQKEGTLYRIADVSGVNGTLSGVPEEIAKAPANEAWRGVAFAPGTTFETGGTPPPSPTISAAENALAAAKEDPTNKTMPLTVEDSAYAAKELTVTVASSKESVAPVSGITVTGTGKERTLHVTPGEVGVSKLTVTVEAPNGVFASTQLTYGVSAYQGDPSDRYYSKFADTGATLDVGGGYMLVAGDESNELRLYKERESGPPVKTWDFDSDLPFGSNSDNIHGMTRSGNTVYFVGGMANTNSGVVEPSHNTMFSARITGSGASTELDYVGSYTGLREDLIEWDTLNGSPLGLQASAAPGQAGETASGFKIQGVEFLPGSSTEAYIAFRAPLEPPGEGAEDRNKALVIPVTNFSSLFNGNPGTTHGTFGTPLEWNLGGLTIRQIRANGEGEYLILASTANSSDTVFQLWGWDGEPEDEPVLLNSSIPLVEEGTWDAITSTPEPIRNGDAPEVLQDNSKTTWYGPGTKDAEKGLTVGLQKSLGRLATVRDTGSGDAQPAAHLGRDESQQRQLHRQMEAGADAPCEVHAPRAERGKRWLDHGREQPEQTRIQLPPAGRGDLELPGQGEQRNRRKRLLGRIRSDQGRPHRTARAHAAPRTRDPGLLGQRRLVQGHRDGLLHLQRGPGARRWQPGQWRRTLDPDGAENVQHQRLVRSLRHRRRQSRQRVLQRLPHRAGGRDAADARNQLPGHGRPGRKRERDRDRLRRSVGPRSGPERVGSDRNRENRPADDHPHRDRQRRPRNHEVVYHRSRLRDAGRADAHRGGQPEQRELQAHLDGPEPGLEHGADLHAPAAPDHEPHLDDRGQRARNAELRIPEIGQGG